MSLFVIIGPQAVGKMTVGKVLEQEMDAKLLYNHQTIDLFANFLGYTPATFDLSDRMRKALFKAFVEQEENNVTKSIIFTVMIAFDEPDDVQFLKDISEIFLSADEEVYFIELNADVETRLDRNIHEDRLAAKPSKRNIEFSKKDLLDTYKIHQLTSSDGFFEKAFPAVHYLKIDNTNLAPSEVVEKIKINFYL